MLHRWSNAVLCFLSESYREHVATQQALVAAQCKISQLNEENKSMALSTRNATEKAVNLQEKLNDLLGSGCATCEVLKRQVNCLMMASGSRVVMFPEVGPTPPPSKYEEKPPEGVGPQRGRQVAAQYNAAIIAKLEQEASEYQQRLQAQAVSEPS